MKYSDVIVFVKCDIKSAASHTLSVNGAYSLTRFKIEIDRLFSDYIKKSEAFANEAGIKDTAAFDARMNELKAKEQEKKLNKTEAAEYKDAKEKLAKAVAMRNKLENEDVDIVCRPMSYEDWHKFKEENQGMKWQGYELFVISEQLLENILWKAPEE